MFARAIVTVLFALLSFSSAAARPLTQAEKDMISEVLTYELTDPQSAQIQWFDFNGDSLYCGRMNAKNLNGGYVGFRPFSIHLALRDGVLVEARNPEFPTSKEADLAVALRVVCQSHGYEIR